MEHCELPQHPFFHPVNLGTYAILTSTNTRLGAKNVRHYVTCPLCRPKLFFKLTQWSVLGSPQSFSFSVRFRSILFPSVPSCLHWSFCRIWVALNLQIAFPNGAGRPTLMMLLGSLWNWAGCSLWAEVSGCLLSNLFSCRLDLASLVCCHSPFKKF